MQRSRQNSLRQVPHLLPVFIASADKVGISPGAFMKQKEVSQLSMMPSTLGKVQRGRQNSLEQLPHFLNVCSRFRPSRWMVSFGLFGDGENCTIVC